MRIMHTDFLRGWGGQPNRILMESEQCAKHGAEVLIAAPTTSELAKRAKLRGLNVNDSIAFRNGLRLSHAQDFVKLRRLILSYKPDILHVHGGKDSWLVAEIFPTIPKAQRPVLVRTKHNIFPIHRHAMNLWLYCSFFDYLLALSNHIKKDLTNVGVREDRVAIIPSAYDDSRFNSEPLPAETRRKIRADFGFSDEHIVCVATGRFEPEKGFELLIESAKRALVINADLRFLLVGDGRLRPNFEAQCSANGLGKDVFVFAGFRDDTPDMFKCADLGIVPSISEGLGTVSLEAGICGLPVLSSRCGGLTDVVISEETGMLFEVGNHRDLTDKLLAMVADRDRLVAMGERAVQRIGREFSPDALGRKAMAFYASILAKRES